jgi:hypothetical protein
MDGNSPPGGASGGPAPAVAMIPLPPGMTQEQFFDVQAALLKICIVAAVSFAVILWDHMVLFPDELKLYQTPSAFKSPSSWAFVALRYGGLLATFVSLFFTSISSDNCQAAASISQVGAIFVTGSAGVIFGARVIAMWSNALLIRGIVGVAFTFMVACWIAVATQYRAVTGPDQPIFSNCIMGDIPKWGTISFASTVVFDLVILVLTLLKLRAQTYQQSKLGFVVYRDSLVYFLCTAVTNIVVLSFQALDESQATLKPMVLPLSTIISVTLGSRVFLNLRLFMQRQSQKSKEKSMLHDIDHAGSEGGSSRNNATRGTGESAGSASFGQTTSLPTYSGVSHNSLPTYSFAVPSTISEEMDDSTDATSTWNSRTTGATLQPVRSPRDNRSSYGLSSHPYGTLSSVASPMSDRSPQDMLPSPQQSQQGHSYPPSPSTPQTTPTNPLHAPSPISSPHPQTNGASSVPYASRGLGEKAAMRNVSGGSASANGTREYRPLPPEPPLQPVRAQPDQQLPDGASSSQRRLDQYGYPADVKRPL